MSSRTSGKSLEGRLDLFIRRNFPQTEIHSGDASVETIDEGTGEVQVSLTSACSGCGISPVTIQALKTRVIAEFEEVDTVRTSIGDFYDDESGAGSEPDVSDAPF